MIRATTNGVLKGYRTNLNRSRLKLDSARNAVLTERNYNSYAEDPSSAAQSFQLRRAYLRAGTQYNTSSSVLHKFEISYQAMDRVVSMVDNNTDDADNTAWGAVLRGANDPTGSGRAALGQDLLQLAESVIQTVNSARYGDTFTFAGADGLNVPFEWKGEGANRQLYFRGIPVDTPLDAAEPPAVKLVADQPQKVDADGNADANGEYYLLAEDGSTVIKISDYDQQKADALALRQLNYISKDETKYADIGLGLQEDDKGNLISSSAYNIALEGINYLGYGVDEDGDPKNIASILLRMGTLLQNCDEKGYWADRDNDGDEYTRLAGKLKTASGALDSQHVKLTAQVNFLNSNHKQLKDTADNLNEQFLDLDQIDLADAITSFSWAQYCYNASLKMGNSILSQSLMDYLN